EVWQEVLDAPRVGVDDDFFALGGHSLKATQVISRLRQVLDLQLPVRALFEHPTIAALAAAVDAIRAAGRRAPGGDLDLRPWVSEPVDPSLDPRALPQSFAQERMWFLDQLEPDSSAYILASALRLDGPLDDAAFGAAVDDLVERHSVLRTTFVADAAGRPIQRIEAAPRGLMRRIDLRHLDPAARDRTLDRLARDHALHRFDLARGPLLRVTLVQLEAASHAALVALHHIAADGWSIGVFVRELGALYAARRRGAPSPLPPLPLQVADVAVAQRRAFTGAVLDGHLAYWRERLTPLADPLALPTDRPRPTLPTYRGATHVTHLDRDDLARLHRFARRRGSTLFMTLLAAWATLLHRLGGQRTLVIGTPTAGRGQVELEGLIGCFLNTLALRVDVDPSMPFGDLLEAVRNEALRAYDHQDLPFERLVEELQPERNFNHMPLFQNLLVVQNAPVERLALPEVTLEMVPIAGRTAKFDLTLTASERSFIDGDPAAGADPSARDGLELALSYKTDLFDATTIRRLSGLLRRLLTAIVAQPETAVGALPLLDRAARHLELEWNDTAVRGLGRTDDDGPDLLHRRVERWASRQPDAPAVRCGAVVLSYRQLIDRAGRIARRLRALGVGPESFVGLWVERSVDFAAGILGILQAGGCYVPMDPRFPRERVRAMLDDAGATAVITHIALAAGDGENDAIDDLGCPALAIDVLLPIDADGETSVAAVDVGRAP
ncbi:MAG: condensation domain-containing protein, partial [Acidobacteriota bacterium]